MFTQDEFWRTFLRLYIGYPKSAVKKGLFDAFSFPEVEEYLDSALSELGILARLRLLDDRLQIAVVPFPGDHTDPVWGYFPINRRRWIARKLDLRPETRILLVFFQPVVETWSHQSLMNNVRHHLGHVLLYLRDPKAKNGCREAEEEWKRCTQPDDGRLGR